MEETVAAQVAATEAVDPVTASEQPQARERTPDVEVSLPSGRGAWQRFLVVLSVLVALAALAAWQFVSLHHQVSRLERQQQVYAKQVATDEHRLSALRGSVSAAVGCLENPQTTPGLCVQFLK